MIRYCYCSIMLPEVCLWSCVFRKMLSVSVADLSVILVGRVIQGVQLLWKTSFKNWWVPFFLPKFRRLYIRYINSVYIVYKLRNNFSSCMWEAKDDVLRWIIIPIHYSYIFHWSYISHWIELSSFVILSLHTLAKDDIC